MLKVTLEICNDLVTLAISHLFKDNLSDAISDKDRVFLTNSEVPILGLPTFCENVRIKWQQKTFSAASGVTKSLIPCQLIK